MTERALLQWPRNILLATNLTSRADRALDRAAQLANAWHAALHIVHAVDAPAPSVPFGVDAEAYLQKRSDPRSLALRQLRQLVDNGSVQAQVHVEDAPPAEAILEVAERESCDLIVLGETRERLVGPWESTVEEVVRKSPVSVLAVRNRPHGPYRRLVVGTDFTDEARQALAASADLFPEAGITLVHAYQMPYAGFIKSAPEGRAWVADQREQLRAQLQATDLPAGRKELVRMVVDAGPPAAVLRAYIMKEGGDLTVIGAHRRGMLFDAIVGSSRLIVDAIPGDILVVRAGHAETQ